MSSVSKTTSLSPRKKASLHPTDPATCSASKETSSTKKRKVVPPSRPKNVKLSVKLLSENAVAPKRGSSQAAGYDIASANDYAIPPRGRMLVQTDIAVALPDGTYGRIAPRSGLAVKSGIGVGGGVIDGDYRGPVGVCLFNHSDTEFKVKRGDRVAQLVIEVIRTPEVEVVEELDATERGEAGFGSTGVATDVTNTVNDSPAADTPQPTTQ